MGRGATRGRSKACVPCCPSDVAMLFSVLRLSWKRMHRVLRASLQKKCACAHAVALHWQGTQVTNARLRHAQLLEGVVEVLRLLLHLFSNLHELLGGHVLGNNVRRSSVLKARGREEGGNVGLGCVGPGAERGAALLRRHQQQRPLARERVGIRTYLSEVYQRL